VARAFTNTFAGIRPADVPGFVLAQVIGAASAAALFRWLAPASQITTDRAARRESPSRTVEYR
jgi:glycerol uptake facilitator-like aquaporin